MFGYQVWMFDFLKRVKCSTEIMIKYRLYFYRPKCTSLIFLWAIRKIRVITKLCVLSLPNIISFTSNRMVMHRTLRNCLNNNYGSEPLNYIYIYVVSPEWYFLTNMFSNLHRLFSGVNDKLSRGVVRDLEWLW